MRTTVTQRKFAFLVHPRNLDDFFRKFPFLKFLPISIVNLITKHLPPVIVSKITGLTAETGERVDGFILATTLTAKQMMEDKKYAEKKVIQAIQYARRKGASTIGLGSLSSPVTQGGKTVAGKYDMYVTNGNALTAGMTILGIKASAKLRHLDLQKSTVAIVGGTGSIGQAVAKILAQNGLFETLILVGRTPANLQKLQTEIQQMRTAAVVNISTDIDAVSIADVIVMATSSGDILLKTEHIKRDALIYDITQPQNVPRELKTTRPDVLIVDGALVEPPSNIQYYFNLGIPLNTIFACLAETMLLSVSGHQSDFSIGHVTLKNVEYILELAEKYNFKLAPLTSWGQPIS